MNTLAVFGRVFSRLQEAPAISCAGEGAKMAKYPALAKCVEFVQNGRPHYGGAMLNAVREDAPGELAAAERDAVELVRLLAQSPCDVEGHAKRIALAEGGLGTLLGVNPNCPRGHAGRYAAENHCVACALVRVCTLERWVAARAARAAEAARAAAKEIESAAHLLEFFPADYSEVIKEARTTLNAVERSSDPFEGLKHHVLHTPTKVKED